MYNPPHPGEFIQEMYMKPFGLTSRKVARNLNVSHTTIHRLLAGNSNVSPEMALRLSIVFGRSPESWLAMQDSYSLWIARKNVNLDHITKLDLTAKIETG